MGAKAPQTEVKKIKIDASIAKELRAITERGESKYINDVSIKALTVPEWQQFERESKFENAWKLVRFEAEGYDKPFEVTILGSKDMVKGKAVTIVRQIAKEEFSTTSGKVVPKGNKRWVAYQRII